MDTVKHHGDEALYNKLDSSYPTDDDDTEVCTWLIFRVYSVC